MSSIDSDTGAALLAVRRRPATNWRTIAGRVVCYPARSDLPDAHRPETPEDAIRIDRLLRQVWGDHPQYFRIDNLGIDWAEKANRARQILNDILTERSD